MDKEIQTLRRFFNYRPPTISLYKEIRDSKSLRQRINILRVIGRLAVGYWEELSVEYKDFVTSWIASCREEYTAYLVNHTPVGQNRLTLRNRELFISWIILLVKLRIISTVSCMHIASNLVMLCDLKLQAQSLRVYLHKKNVKLEEVLQLLGMLTVDEDTVHVKEVRIRSA